MGRIASENKGVIVMGATNRPFALDDAVLRRFPRRLLVDLPAAADREAILRTILRDDVLDASVDVRAVAERTEMYSGSDLKNLCMVAALMALKEKRLLARDHLERALGQVAASVSEGMESLVELRKWDQEFGEGERQKTAAIGF